MFQNLTVSLLYIGAVEASGDFKLTLLTDHWISTIFAPSVHFAAFLFSVIW